MAKSAQLLTENDGDDLEGEGQEMDPRARAAEGLPEGLSPVNPAPIQHRQPPEKEPTYEPIEVDDQGRPFGDQGGDARLTQDEVGERPLIEQQQGGGRTREDRLAERRQRKAAQRTARDKSYTENRQLREELAQTRAVVDDLTARFGTVEPRVIELGEGNLRAQRAGLDTAIAQAQEAMGIAQRELAQAISEGNGEAIGAILQKRDQAAMRAFTLTTQRDQWDARARQGGGASQDPKNRVAPDLPERGAGPRPLPPVAQRYVNDFAETHDWYDPNGRDRDSKRVLMLDREIAEEGYDPTTQDYWDELEDRMREILPHRFQPEGAGNGGQRPAPRQNGGGNGAGNGAAAPARQVAVPANGARRGPPVAGAGTGGNGAGAPNKVAITPQRRQAMEEAGVINPDGSVANREKFNRTLAHYAAYDRANPQPAR